MKRFLYYALCIIAVMTTVAACRDAESYVNVSAPEINFTEEGGSHPLSIASNASWVVTADKAWLEISIQNGSGDMVVVLKAPANTTLADRICVLTITTIDGVDVEQVTVKQSAAASELLVDVNDIILASSEGSKNTFTIKSNDKWTITGQPDWLDLSTTAGTGDVTITVTTKTTNYSAEDRSAVLNVASSVASYDIAVFQKAAWLANCVAKPVDLTVLYNCAGFGWEFSDEVAYYYYGELEKSEADRMTPVEIVEWLQEEGSRDTPGDGYINSTYGDLYSLTEYVLYTVAFNKDGVQGELYSVPFVTKSSTNQPYATAEIYDFDYSYWYWRSKIGPYAKAYYMWYTQDFDYMTLTDGLVAYVMMRDIESEPDTYPKILQNGEWKWGAYAYELMVVTWGISSDDELGGYILREAAQLTDETPQMTIKKENNAASKKTKLTYEEYCDMRESFVRVY